MELTGYIFSALLIAFAAIGLLFGLIRGTKKAVVRFIVVVLSAFLAVGFAAQITDYVLTEPFSEWPVDVESTLGDITAYGENMQEVLWNLLRSEPSVAELLETAPTLTDFIMMAPRSIVGVLLFVLLFFVTKFVLGIAEWLFKLIFIRDGKGKLVGGIIGAVQGAFCALVVLVPVFGLMTVADSAILTARDMATEDTPDDSIITYINEFDTQFYTPMQQDPVYGILKDFGIDAMCTEVFYAVSNGQNAKGETVNFFRTLSETVPALIQIAELQTIDFENMSGADWGTVRELAKSFADTPLIANSVAELLQGGSDSLLAGEDFMGITYPADLDDKTDAFFTDVLTTLADADQDTLVADLPQIIDVVSVLVDNGVIDAMSSPDAAGIEEIVKDEEFLNDLLNEMTESQVLSAIAVSAINNFGMTTLAESLAIPKNSDEAYSAMVDELDAELAKYSDLDMTSVVLLSTEKTEAERAVESVAKILLHYTKNLSEENARATAHGMLSTYCTTGATPATKENISVDLSMTAVTALQRDTYEPACITLDDMLISDVNIFTNMDEEERQSEIAKLTKIVSSAVTLVSDLESGVGDITENLDILPTIGELMNTMSDSTLLSDASQNVMVHFVSSDAVSDLLDETAVETLKDKISEGKIDYESTFTSITASFKLIEFLNSPPDITEANPEQLTEIVELLFTSIDETTIEILQKTVNADFLAKMGVPEEAVEVSGIVVQTLFAEIGKAVSDEEGALDYAAEGKAIQSMIGLLMKNGEEMSDEFMTDLIIDTLLESDTITNTLIAVCKNEIIMNDMAEWIDEEDRAAAAEVIAEYEAALDAEDIRAKECINAIRVLLGISA